MITRESVLELLNTDKELSALVVAELVAPIMDTIKAEFHTEQIEGREQVVLSQKGMPTLVIDPSWFFSFLKGNNEYPSYRTIKQGSNNIACASKSDIVKAVTKRYRSFLKG